MSVSVQAPGQGPEPSAAVDGDRLRRLVATLTVEQKVRLLTGADFWALHAEPGIGLRRLVTSDGPAGVRGELWDERDTSANIPSPTALAASWDLPLVGELGRFLAYEARRKGVDVVLAPTVNLQRSPYGGRHFECFSEDPLLTGLVGSALVEGLQREGVAATVKHFVANDAETDRYTADVVVDERALRELYLAPFEVIVREAGVWAVMAAYNSVAGSSMTQSPLLRSILHHEWGFDGVTMTDWYAGRSTESAARSGLDLMMPGPTSPWGDALVTAVHEGRVAVGLVDEKVQRLLRLADRVGALGDESARPAAPQWVDTDAQALVRRAGTAGFVLLRNADVDGRPALPLDRAALGSVAVIGPNSRVARTLGGGSALVFPDYTVSPLAGIRAALGHGVQVTHSEGVRAHSRIGAADPELLSTAGGERGVRLVFLDSAGEVLGTEVRTGTAYNWNNAFGAVDRARLARIELHTTVTAAAGGDYRIGVSGVGRFGLVVDGALAFDERLELPDGADPVEGLMRPPQQWETVRLRERGSVEVVLTHVLEERDPGDDLLVSFQFNVDIEAEDDESAMTRAVELAARSDVAVVVVGTTEEVESEGFDRDTLALPGRQDELVRRIAAVRPETVVIVNSGAPVLLPWRDDVAATLVAWFPGQEFGNALADVLLGVVEPTGRLPTTWPVDEVAALPSTRPVDGTVHYDESIHVGYRRFLRDRVTPAYWFGHGLGYTTWTYENLAVDGPVTPDGADVTVTLRNTGTRAGRQVVQVYLARRTSAVDRPVRWLAGLAVVEAVPGRSAMVGVHVPARAFAHWDVASHDWVVEPGEFHAGVGPSAGDIARWAPVVVLES